ncbi:MAG TPA: hypothetical protein VHA79_12835 [Mycobacteriales bacterium]|nr:hypothetical protein [Mycobacteriales bacterium]
MKSAAPVLTHLSRRSILGLAALGLAGCKAGSSAASGRAEPDAAALVAARSSEAVLVAACMATGLAGEAVVHRQHLAALGGTETVPTTLNTPARSAVRALLRDNADKLRSAATGAVDGSTAALLASIAAAHEVAARE